MLKGKVLRGQKLVINTTSGSSRAAKRQTVFTADPRFLRHEEAGNRSFPTSVER